LTIICGVFCLPVVSFAQDDPSAGKLLDRLSQKYRSFASYEANITQRLSNTTEGLNESMAGSLTVKGNQYLLSFGPQEVANDGMKVYVYLKELDEVTIDYYYEENNNFSIASIAYFDKDHYTYRGVGNTQVNGVSCALIDLVPKEQHAQFFRIQMAISDDALLQQVQMWDRSGTSYTYTFSNIKTNLQISDKLFQFNEKTHPGATITDLTE